MTEGDLFFISDSYCNDFNDKHIMCNKPPDALGLHGRPHCLGYIDSKTGLFWMIPISSQVVKYQSIYNKKINSSGRCDTITFYKLNGNWMAFLLQNMIPVTNIYICCQYRLPSANAYLNSKDITDLRSKTIKVLSLVKSGRFKIFTDIIRLENALLTK